MAKMQWSLFLLIVIGQCFFFPCHLYEYHFIGEMKSWVQAQKYCREKYTDLATVSNMTDLERLRDSTKMQEEAWIGLHSNPGKENRMWHWSLPGVEFNNTKTEWGPNEPNDKECCENCVDMDPLKWMDFPCNTQKTFICYNEANQSNKFHLIDTKMTWPQAQNYCREHHTDLVSGLSQLEELKKETMPKADCWIGLFRDTWRWSDGSNSSFRNWDLELFNDENGIKTCAKTVLNRFGKWDSDDCQKTKPFFCYDDKVILIKENKTWEEALYYCRENYNDLVSIPNPYQQRWVQERAKMATTPFVWLGLRYTCTLDFWFWVSDEVVNYKNWAPNGAMDQCDTSGAMARGGGHEWFKKMDNEEFNFICSKC